jgi:hypothetical protein
MKETLKFILYGANAISIMKALDYLGFNKYYTSHALWILIGNFAIIFIVAKYWDRWFK